MELDAAESSALLGKNPATFAATVRAINDRLAPALSGSDITLRLLTLISESDLVGTEKSRRTRSILDCIRPAFSDELLSSISLLSRDVKAGAAQLVPDAMLGKLFPLPYSAEDQTSDTPTESSAASIHFHTPKIEVLTRDAVVLVLSSVEQQATIGLLQSVGFEAFRVPTMDQLRLYLEEPDVCGFIIHGSFWTGWEQDSQDGLLHELASYSSLTCIIVDKTGYHLRHAIRDIIKAVWCCEPTSAQLQIRTKDLLVEHEIDGFIKSANLISDNTLPKFVLADLSPRETTALVAASKRYFENEFYAELQTLKTLNVKILQKQPGKAALISVQYNGNGAPIVAKIGNIGLIDFEIKRFRKFVAPIDPQLRPSITQHCGTGVIIFGMVEDASASRMPAPPLHTMIRSVCREEHQDASVHCVAGQYTSVGQKLESITESTANIEVVVHRTCTKLMAINKASCPESHFTSFAYLSADSFVNLEKLGIEYSFLQITSDDLKRAIEQATNLVRPLQGSAIVHGDLNLSNILVRSERDPYIIDYAYCGPGHPTYDLVRLECALMLEFMRQVGSEREFSDLQFAFSSNRASAEEVTKEFPRWMASPLNAALIRSAICCRDSSFEVLEAHGALDRQYLACKLLMLCYSLTMNTLQHALTRASISATVKALSLVNAGQTQL